MRQHWKYIFLSLAIGLFIGTTGTFFAMHLRSHQEWRPRQPGGMRRMLYNDLQLSQDQKVRLETILSASREKIDAIRNAARADIKQILTSEQQTKFDAINARMDERRKKWMSRRHPMMNRERPDMDRRPTPGHDD